MIAIGRMCSLSDTLNGKLAQPDLMAEAVKTVQNAASPALLACFLADLSGFRLCIHRRGLNDRTKPQHFEDDYHQKSASCRCCELANVSLVHPRECVPGASTKFVKLG